MPTRPLRSLSSAAPPTVRLVRPDRSPYAVAVRNPDGTWTASRLGNPGGFSARTYGDLVGVALALGLGVETPR